MSNNDELVSQFMSFTGSADPDRAASYLEMSGGDLQTAVSLFMEHETTTTGSDSALLQQQLHQQQDIRAPDATRTMRLMDDHAGMLQDPSLQYMNALMEDQMRYAFADGSATQVDARAVVNAAAAAAEQPAHQDDDSYQMEEDDDEVIPYVAAAPPPAARLSEMFAPPTHLMHRIGGFQGARAAAKDARRWLLVNIQKDDEFSCHALNRDVWRDDLVENVVREGFIFWQQMDTHPDGRTFMERYAVSQFPHISIIDPRTGRLLWRKEGWTMENPMTAGTFAEFAMDFLSRNSFDRPPQAPRPTSSSAAVAASTTTQQQPRSKRTLDMTEEEQVEAAMRASMEDIVTVDVDNDNDDDSEVQILEDISKTAPSVAFEETKPSFNQELLQVALGEEPTAGPRIQFRLPDGKRVVRRFVDTDPVRMIYAFIAQTNDETRSGRAFLLMAGYPPNDLINDINKTIADCKLSGQAITVRWRD